MNRKQRFLLPLILTFALPLLFVYGQRQPNLAEEGLFPTSMDDLLMREGNGQFQRQPGVGNPIQAPAPIEPVRPIQADPRALPATRRPAIVAPEPATQPRERRTGTIPTEILLPAPEPVARGLRAPTTPTIIFGEAQTGLPSDAIEEEGELFDPGELLREQRFDELEPWVVENQDAGMASALGWAYYEKEDRTKAIEWFQNSLRWDESQNEAAFGLALALYNEGFLQQAEAVANWKVNEYPALRNVLGDIHMTRAISSFREERYQETLNHLGRVREFRNTTRGEEVLAAWSTYHLGDLDGAYRRFLDLYRADRDEVSAVGLYASLSVQQDWERIERHVNELGGPLADIYSLYSSERYFDRRLYLRARQVAPEAESPIENIETPHVTLAIEAVDRAGDSGISRLRIVEGPKVIGHLFQDQVNRFEVALGFLSLDAGDLPDRAFVGLVPRDFATNPRQRYVIAPKTNYQAMILPSLFYYREAWTAPYIELGMTPMSGAVEATVVGRLGVDQYYDSGRWRIELYRESKKESLLSYTGFRDPWSALTYGRAVDTGLRLGIFHSFAQDIFTIEGQLAVGQVGGENILDNEHYYLNFKFSRTFHPPYFHYVNFGPIVTAYGYANNQSFFTYGHGGYFSPSMFGQAVMNLQGMTLEGKNFLLKGEAGFGFQANEQDAAPLFPTRPDGRSYQRSTDSSLIFLSDMKVLFALTRQWTFGFGLGYNKTPSYEEFRGGMFSTVYFAPRRGMFESDFPRYQY